MNIQTRFSIHLNNILLATEEQKNNETQKMFYIWHTLLVLLFIVFAFFMGYKLGKGKQDKPIKQEKGSCPFLNNKNFL